MLSQKFELHELHNGKFIWLVYYCEQWMYVKRVLSFTPMGVMSERTVLKPSSSMRAEEGYETAEESKKDLVEVLERRTEFERNTNPFKHSTKLMEITVNEMD
jgi:hypothetical protein